MTLNRENTKKPIKKTTLMKKFKLNYQLQFSSTFSASRPGLCDVVPIVDAFFRLQLDLVVLPAIVVYLGRPATASTATSPTAGEIQT
jgi:hypothetical protein